MNEKQMWSNHLRPVAVKVCRGRWERVENMVADGTPDVNYCLRGGKEGWLELKTARGFPIRNPDRGVFSFSGNHPLLQTQINWHLDQAQHGGRSHILAFVPLHGYYLVPGRLAEQFNGASIKGLEKLSVAHGFDLIKIFKALL